MSTDPQHPIPLVILATAWVPKFGGINAFNEELTRSLGVKADRAYELICVVPRATEIEVAEAAGSCHVRLLVLGDVTKDGELPAELAAHALGALNLSAHQQSRAVWVGHDDKSGPLAIALRNVCVGSKAVLIHHMAFGAYQDFKKLDHSDANAKTESQGRLFEQADLCLAVGPLLQGQLKGQLANTPGAPAVEMLVPGLAEPDPDQILLTDVSPDDFTAFLGGRLGSDDERIKQTLLGVRGFGHAVSLAFGGTNGQHAIRRSPKLRVRGVPDEQCVAVKSACTEAASGQVIAFDLQTYTHDRNAYFKSLAGSSVAMMPSWHEGFGLTAWEAIACRVPVVIGEQSGVYRLLNQRCQGAGLGKSVRAVNVQGLLPKNASEAPHTDADVAAVGTAIHAIGDHLIETKANAVQLAQNLRNDHGFTWTRCAADAIAAMQKHLQVSLTHQPVISQKINTLVAQAIAPSDAVPEWLQVPQPRRIQTELGASPLALLVARDRVVSFDAVRQPLVNAWLNHLHSPARPHITLRLVTGAGGTGKTRSALELLDRAQQSEGLNAQAWTPLWMPAEAGSAKLAEWRAFLQTQTSPCLLVVDYAEGRQRALLQWLHAAFQVAAGSTASGHPLRLHVLCLARTAAWWQELPRSADCPDDVANLLGGPANLGVMTMPEWPSDAPTRRATFDSALQGYAAAQAMSAPASVWQPQLDQAPYERPLYIHLAALAALAGERPAHAQALLGAQLKREFDFVCRTEKSLGHAPPRYADWANAMAWLGLVQGAPSAALDAALTALKTESPGLVTALRRACEVESETGKTSLAALQPDLLVEALIVEQLAARQGAAILDLALLRVHEASNANRMLRALEVIARLGLRVDMDKFGGAKAPPLWIAKTVAGLARAWPEHGNLLVKTAHATGYELGQWLQPSWQALTAQMQERVAASLELPKFSTALIGLAVEVAEAKVRSAPSPQAKAFALAELATCLSDLGGAPARAKAITAGVGAVSLIRKLAMENPELYERILASYLGNLSGFLLRGGEANSGIRCLSAANEAISICRRLAQGGHPDDLSAFARAKHALTNCLDAYPQTSNIQEALALARESVEILRPLSSSPRSIYRPQFAASLCKLGGYLSRCKDSDSLAEAVETVREAVAICRYLTEIERSAYLPKLANALQLVAVTVARQGRPESRKDALASLRETVTIFRELEAGLSSAWMPSLALSLNNLAAFLSEESDLDLRSEALRTARDAVTKFAVLYVQIPARHSLELLTAIRTLRQCCKRLEIDGESEMLSLVESMRFEANGVSATNNASDVLASVNTLGSILMRMRIPFAAGNLIVSSALQKKILLS
jgi:tetratricopeptide (TPR) repeat protein